MKNLFTSLLLFSSMLIANDLTVIVTGVQGDKGEDTHISAGLGGLTAGALLVKDIYKVTMLEQHNITRFKLC